MNHNFVACPEVMNQSRSGKWPCLIKGSVWNGPISDWDVEPTQSRCLCRLTDIGYTQRFHLVGFHGRHKNLSAPAVNHPKVNG